MGLLSNIVDPLAGYYEGKARLRGAKAGAKIANQGYDDVTQQAGELNTSLQQQWDPYQQYGGAGRSALEELLTGKRTTIDPVTGAASTTSIEGWENPFNTPDFNYEGNVDDFMSPAVDFMRKQGVASRDASAASRGGIFNSGYEKQLEDFGQGLGSQEYGNAFERLTTDKNQQLAKYNSVLDQSRQARQQRIDGLEGMVNTGYNADTQSAQALKDFYGTQQQSTLGKAGVNSELAAMKEQQKGAFGPAMWKSLAGVADAGLGLYAYGGGFDNMFTKNPIQESTVKSRFIPPSPLEGLVTGYDAKASRMQGGGGQAPSF
jgi:hypothetical protein